MKLSFFEDLERLTKPLNIVSALAEVQKISQYYRMSSALEVLEKQQRLFEHSQLAMIRSTVSEIQERLLEQQRAFRSLSSSALCIKDRNQVDNLPSEYVKFQLYILQEATKDMDFVVWSALSNGPPNSVKGFVLSVLEAMAPIVKCSAIGLIESVRSQIRAIRKANWHNSVIRRKSQQVLRSIERCLAKISVTVRTWRKATLLPKTRIRATCGLLTTFQTCAP